MKKTSAGGVVFPLVLAASGVLVAAGVVLALTEASANRQLVGCALLAAGAVGAILTVLLFVLHRHLNAVREEAGAIHEQSMAMMAERLSAITVLLNVVTEQQLISDRAKSVAYREKDRDALRRAIREETSKGDWEAARVLVNAMEQTFGSRQEADRYRSEISEAWNEQTRRRMVDVQERIERMCRSEDWHGAHQEAAKFIAEHPDYEPARRLVGDVDARKQGYKKQLLDRWNDCVLRHDGDSGMEVLRLLDPYLSPAEAERMAESARSIFNDRKANLREQFTAAATAHSWHEAIRIGEVIQREFPNAKFAQEIFDMMPTLRARAAEDSEPAVSA